jgi:hypothetical protein
MNGTQLVYLLRIGLISEICTLRDGLFMPRKFHLDTSTHLGGVKESGPPFFDIFFLFLRTFFTVTCTVSYRHTDTRQKVGIHRGAGGANGPFGYPNCTIAQA